MKTCPTCKGEGKVKELVKDSMPAVRAALLRGLLTAGKVALLAIFPFVIAAIAIGLARAICWSINEPLMTQGIGGSSSPNGFLESGAVLGAIGGLGLSFFLALEFNWKDEKK